MGVCVRISFDCDLFPRIMVPWFVHASLHLTVNKGLSIKYMDEVIYGYM